MTKSAYAASNLLESLLGLIFAAYFNPTATDPLVPAFVEETSL